MRIIFIFITIVILAAMISFTNKTGLSITSRDFVANGMIPSKYTCEGDNISPQLTVSGIPSGTKSLALICHDPDAPVSGGFTHWVMWNIDINGNIPENFKGANQGLNGTKQSGYKGMCPPTGTHHYHFRVYALDTKLPISDNTDKDALEKAMHGHILAEGDLVGLYKKLK